MTKHCSYSILFILASIFSVISCHEGAPENATTTPSGDQKVFVQYTTYKTEIGWGYDILVNKKIYIHQDYIPAVQGKQGFESETQAATVAEAILDKLKNGKKPFITLAELKIMGCLPKPGFQ